MDKKNARRVAYLVAKTKKNNITLSKNIFLVFFLTSLEVCMSSIPERIIKFKTKSNKIDD